MLEHPYSHGRNATRLPFAAIRIQEDDGTILAFGQDSAVLAHGHARLCGGALAVRIDDVDLSRNFGDTADHWPHLYAIVGNHRADHAYKHKGRDHPAARSPRAFALGFLLRLRLCRWTAVGRNWPPLLHHNRALPSAPWRIISHLLVTHLSNSS